MAEQDFDIKIRIQADTAQVETIRRSFEQLGAQVEVTNRKAAAAAAAAAGAGAGNAAQLGRLIGGLTGVGIGAGLFQFVEGLKKASAEIAKVSVELDKQGEQLLKNAQLFGVQAKQATDSSDVIKISAAALKEIESTQKTVTDLSQKELGYSAQISDYLQKQMLARQRLAGMGDYEAAREENLNTAISQNQQARESAFREIDDAQKAQHRGINEIVEDIQRAIALEEKRAATARGNLDAATYAEAVNALTRYNQELEKSLELRKKQDVKDFGRPLTNLERPQQMRTQEYGRLQKQLGQLSALGEGRDLTPAESATARDEFVNTQTELRNKFIEDRTKAREEQAAAKEQRYRGPPERQPGQTQIERNADVVSAIEGLKSAITDLWK